MIDHDDARTTVLGRVRAALAAEPPAQVVIPRDYDREPLSGSGDVTRFAETVAEYRAQVTRIDAAAISVTVASLVPPGAPVVVPADQPTAWVEGVDALIDDPPSRCRSHDWMAPPRSSPAARRVSRRPAPSCSTRERRRAAAC